MDPLSHSVTLIARIHIQLLQLLFNADLGHVGEDNVREESHEG